MDYINLLELWDQATMAQLIAPVSVASLVTLLCVIYFVRYFVWSFVLSVRLKRLSKRIRKLGDVAPAKRRAELDALFQKHKLGHAWHEYAETLHDQHEVRDGEQLSPEELEALNLAIVTAIHERMGYRPGRVYLLRPRSIPLTHNGKLKHQELKRQYLDGALRQAGAILFPEY